MRLHNIKSKTELLKDLNSSDCKRLTVSFYRYIELEDIDSLRDQLFLEWSELGVLGRIYLAPEGINAQFSIPEENWPKFIENLESREAFREMPFKKAIEEGLSFIKLVIKIKKEIVAYKVPESEYDIKQVGKHLDYRAFNKAIDEGAIVVDMRNQYEGEVGKFENAIIPDVERSQELLPEVKRLLKGKEEEKVLIYCTGGIRCEKASAYLMHHGFNDINQLEGGIIQYANDVKANNVKSKFIGKNFVFDARMGERITDDIISKCHQCQEKADRHTNCANQACHILFIQCETCRDKYHNCCSEACADFIKLPVEEQKTQFKNGQVKFTAQMSDKIKPRLADITRESQVKA